jgi:phage gp45-like
MTAQDAYDARATIQIGDVQSIDDTGQAQTVTVMTSAGAIYSDVEVIQSFGMGGSTPVDGALALLFAVGGDPANLRALLYNPSYRFGNQAEGEMTLFAPDGTRVSVRAGGIIDIIAGNQVNITAPNVVINAAASVTITAPNVNVVGNLLVTSGVLKVNGVTVTVP